jgi:glycosyltransferase involved in cell wall biosynthesis
MLPISVVVPTKNESVNLQRCLAALRDFDEIIVIDSNSTDGTQQVAGSFRATVVNFEWNGSFPKKRNWVLMNYTLKHQWVLFIDADEIVNHAFIDEALRGINTDEYAGFWINYSTYFMGRRLKYGIAQKKLALFKTKSGLYERIDERTWTSLDMEVHEHPCITGKVGEIKAKIEHNDFKSLELYIDRHNKYSSWEARRVHAIRHLDIWRNLTPRQKVKYTLVGKIWFPFFYFIVQYWFLGGFLDGGPGFSFALFKCFYFFQIRSKLTELQSYTNS